MTVVMESGFMQEIDAFLLLLGYLTNPLLIIVGWTKWAKRNEEPSPHLSCSSLALILGTISALIAAAGIVAAHKLGGLAYYDPRLLWCYRLGTLTAGVALPLAGVGMWRASTVRWYALAASLGMLLFWLMMAAGE